MVNDDPRGASEQWPSRTARSAIASSLPDNFGNATPRFPAAAAQIPKQLPQLPLEVSPAVRAAVPPTLTGTAAFYSTLALSTLIQGRVLGVSTGSMPPVPTLLGIASVAVASLAGHGMSVWTVGWMAERRRGGPMQHGFWGRPVQPLEEGISQGHALRVAALGLITFKLLSGRFWSISPSSFTNLGSFARPSVGSIPATMNYATSSQRSAVERLGRKWGCHTCGSKMVFGRGSGAGRGVRFHADHMPPKAVADQMNRRLFRRLLGRTVKQRFYPQCTGCSNVQGGILASASNELRRQSMKGGGGGGLMKLVPLTKLPKASNANTNLLAGSGGGRAAHMHGFRIRLHHLAGGVVAGATVYDANEVDVVRDGNERRFWNMQQSIEGMVCDFRSWVEGFGIGR